MKRELDYETMLWAMRRLFAMGLPEHAAQLSVDFHEARRFEKRAKVAKR